MIKKTRMLAAGLLAMIFILSIVVFVRGDPVGGIISDNSTDQRTTSPGSRADDGGTITTMNVDATQQNYAWKAYVGNISGSLVLDDSSNRSIYEWALSTLTGEIIATRASSLTWGALSCASNATIATEQSAVSMSPSDLDSLNTTFIATAHKAFSIAGNTLTANTCRSTATYVNDTAQTPSSSADFQEILVNDTSGNVMYVADLELNTQGFDNNTYDFQMIVADDDTAATITTYYFYVELDS
ncbi:MAG: hypothetical protein ABH828_03475 [archaeon]